MDYLKQGEDFLQAHGLEFRAVLVGDDCPRFCEDQHKEQATQRQTEYRVNQYPRKTHIHGKHYRCTISGKERGHVSFDFWNSYADEEYNALGCQKYRNGEQLIKYSRKLKDGKWVSDGPKTPKAYDLLACITKNDPGTFADFCSGYGYDEDSRTALDVYLAVQDECSKVRRFFTTEELEQLQEIN